MQCRHSDFWPGPSHLNFCMLFDNETKFDLIILDIMMPGKSGLEFTQQNKNTINTPIILLTAKGEVSERVEGLEVGADDYLPKPFEPKELVLRIKNLAS